MGYASHIYIDYLRLQMWWVFIAGLLIVLYRNRSHVAEFLAAHLVPPGKHLLDPTSEYHARAGKAVWRLIFPIWAWMICFGVTMIVIDMILGPK